MNNLRPILQITRSPFWIHIYLFLTVECPQNFTINAMTLILIFVHVVNCVNYPFLIGDVQRRPSYGVYLYISQLKRFAWTRSHVDELNARNECLTAKLLKKG